MSGFLSESVRSEGLGMGSRRGRIVSCCFPRPLWAFRSACWQEQGSIGVDTKESITVSDHIVNRWKKRVPGVVSAALQGCRRGVEFQDEFGRKSSGQRLWQQQSALPREPEDSRSTQAASCGFLVGRVGVENWRRQDR